MQIQINNNSPPRSTETLDIFGLKSKTKGDAKDNFKFQLSQNELTNKMSSTRSDNLQNSKINEPKLNKQIISSNASEVDEVERDTTVKMDSFSSSKKEIKGKDSKRSAVQKFMDSIEGKLGISTERFSVALAQLPAEVKNMSVEESAPFVIQQLGVQEEHLPKMTEAYLNLIDESGISSVNQKNSFKGSLPINNLEEVAPEWQNINDNYSLLQSKESYSDNLAPNSNIDFSNQLKPFDSMSPKQKLNASIDEMNRRFFGAQAKPSANITQNLDFESASHVNQNISDGVLVENKDPYIARGLLVENPEITSKDLNSLIEKSSPPNTDFNERFNSTFNGKVYEDSAIQTEGIAGLSPQNQYQQDSIINSKPEGVPFDNSLKSLRELYEMVNESSKENILNKSELLQSSGTNNWTVEELPYLSPLSLKDSFTPSNEQENFDSKNQFSLNEGAIERLSDEKDEGDPDDLNELINNFNVRTEEVNGKPTSSLTNIKEGLLNSVSNQDRSENIKKLSQATETLSARGGGEVKISLAPEGIGSVQLKVRLQEGKVQLEIRAENKESQKLLENSLHELKNNLSSHQISLESVKVDVGGDYTRGDPSQSDFQQPQMDLGREQARQFMNQFREGNLFQKQNLFEAPGFKTYQAQRDDSLQPISREIRPRGSLNTNKGRDLNLVA